MRKCPRCKVAARPRDKWCPYCSTPLPALTEFEPEVAESTMPVQAEEPGEPGVPLSWDDVPPEPSAPPGLLGEQALRDARPAVAFRRVGAGSRSHVGGDALVPADFEWPRYRGTPLPLLLELDLAEFEGLDDWLPSSGRLLLFGPTDDLDEAQVVFFESPRSPNVYAVRYVTAPGAPRTEGLRFEQEGLVFESPFDDLPCPQWPGFDELLSGLDDDARTEARERISDARRRVPYQVLGHSHPVQGEPTLEALAQLTAVGDDENAWAALRKESMSWVCVLQLEAEGGWSFAGSSRLYVVAPRGEVAAGRFEGARVVVQR
jgi:hypothetical protein